MKSPRCTLLLLATLAASLAQAAVHTTNLTFSSSQFHVEPATGGSMFEGQAYQMILGDGMDVSDEAGAPQLPVQPVVIALQGHQEVKAVTFEAGEWKALGGTCNVLPAQKQQVLVAGTDLAPKSKARSQELALSEPRRGERFLDSSDSLEMTGRGESNEPRAKADDGVEFTAPNPAIYSSHVPYPTSPFVWTGTSYRRGSLGTGTVFLGGKPCQSLHDSTFVQVLVYPVRYVGAEKRVEVCRKVKVKVEVEVEAEGAKAEARGQKLEVRGSSSSHPSPLRGEGERSEGEEALGGFEYVIVTGQGLDSVFQRLADWKTEKGVPAVVRTMDWVYANYTGRDQAEQLRNYLKTLPDSGVKYVLLGGDVDVVPFRKAYAMTCGWGSMAREDSLPCDLYFADLDGSWDANNNNVFGEVDDSVDLYADLSVGRAPVNNVTQAQTFVRKVLDYEHAAVPGYQNKGLFFAMVLWQNPYTDQGVHKNKMEQQSFASGYSLTKLYQSLGNETHDAVMQAIRENQNFLNHDGHGWFDVMSCGEGVSNRLHTADADTITNAGLGVLYSIGCWTTAFDFTSIGEAFVTNPNGGTVATIGNSSYGWGSPGNPGFGYSDKYDSHFWHAITSDGIYRVGDALAAAKEYYAPFSRDQNVYRWHQYDVNLMGDPEMPVWTPVWTALPESLVVTAPESIGLGSSRAMVAVMDGEGPVKGAQVCLMKGSESYSVGATDGAGQVWIDATPLTPGDFALTVTAHNYLPVERLIPCAVGPCVSYAGWVIDDSLGNSDGIVNASETILLPVWLHNTGQQASGPVTMTLRSDNPHVRMDDSTAEASSLARGESVLVSNAFRFTTAQKTYDGEALRFDLSVGDGGQSLTFHPVIVAGAAWLGLDRWWMTHPPLMPGQKNGVVVRIRNPGCGFGHKVWCRLVSLDSSIVVVRDSVDYGEVQPGSKRTSSDSFVVAAVAECPIGHVALMSLQVNADGFTSGDLFRLLVGESGFADDMERGEAKWSHAGAGDLWHLTSYRTHSGTNAWYCGNEASRLYNDSMDAYLTTVPFSVPQGCTLRFWRWFKTPNYGVDGIRVIVVRGAVEETLDFVGTGGALGRKWSSGPVIQWSSVRTESEATKARTVRQGPQRPRTRNGWRSGEEGTVGCSATRSLLNESGWAEEKYDLSWLGLGEQIQVKLAFVSDGDTVDEGFYIDDVNVTGGGPPVTVAGVQAAPGLFPGLDVWPNPFHSLTQIRYGGSEGLPRLSVYDAAGQIVRRLPASRVAAWDGRDEHGRRLPAGAYFIEARTQSERRLAKVLLAR